MASKIKERVQNSRILCYVILTCAGFPLHMYFQITKPSVSLTAFIPRTFKPIAFKVCIWNFTSSFYVCYLVWVTFWNLQVVVIVVFYANDGVIVFLLNLCRQKLQDTIKSNDIKLNGKVYFSAIIKVLQ